MGKKHINNKIQVSKSTFLAKYGSLDPYDEEMEKDYSFDHEILEFNKTYGWTLIGIPEKGDGTLSDHEYFSYMMIYLIEFNQLIKIDFFVEFYIK